MNTTKEPQIKTLENIVIDILHNAPTSNPVHQAFQKMFEHFIDEDFLYTQTHEEIITQIYEKNFYAYHYAYALPQTFHTDNKTLLDFRKSYLLLFAKYYLGIQQKSKNIFVVLYAELRKEQLLLQQA